MPSAAWVALSLLPHLGGRTFRALLDHFGGDISAILDASADSLREVRGVGPKIAQAIRTVDVDASARALERWLRAGVVILTLDDADYPPALRPLPDAPPTLFVLGLPDALAQGAVAVVGTRAPSPQARTCAQHMGAALAEGGHAIVSGLALGIDSAAHLGALAIPDGATLAVLGGGILNVYPPANRALAEAVIARGALVCEVSPEAPVSAPGLVARNRLITGLADAVIVVETGIEGGAMHAARFARQQGRPLYALDVPAAGNRALLANGAQPIAPDLSDLPPRFPGR